MPMMTRLRTPWSNPGLNQKARRQRQLKTAKRTIRSSGMLSPERFSLASGRSLMASMAMVATLAAFPAQGQSLAPEHEIRRLMLATEEAVAAERWGEASEYLNRLQKMDSEKPADYFFYRGRAMLQAGHLNEARAALEAYVGRAGVDGQHYQQSLKLITDIEKENRANVRALANGNGDVKEPVAIIEDRKSTR